ncbi:hypothetical protein ACOMHN_009733 [Nucella lapillus]
MGGNIQTDKGREAEEERFGENKGGRNAEGLHYADLDLVRKPAPAPAPVPAPRRPIENARPGATSISGSVTTAPASDTTLTEYASIRLY